MLEKAQEYLKEVASFSPKDEKELESFRIRFLSKKGIMNDLFASFKTVPNEQKKAFGQVLNQLKQAAQNKLEAFKDSFDDASANSAEDLDLSRPVTLDNLGSRHPISLVRNEIVEIFKRIGFTVSEGPEMEDDWHNFSALNLPDEHPARDMQDTFLLKKIRIYYCVHTPHRCRFATWKITNLQSVLCLQEGFIETRPSQLERIVFFIKLRGYTLIKMFLLLT